MKNTIFWIGIAILAILSFTITFNLYENNKDSITNIEEENQLIKKILTTEIQQQNFSGYSIKTDDETKAKLLNLLSNNKKLIFRIAPEYCESCIDNAIAELSTAKDKINTDNIIIIASINNNRDSLIIRNRFQNRYQYIFLSSDNYMYFKNRNEIIQSHFYTVDSTLLPTHLYIYTPTFPKRNKEYFDIIAEYINKI